MSRQWAGKEPEQEPKREREERERREREKREREEREREESTHRQDLVERSACARSTHTTYLLAAHRIAKTYRQKKREYQGHTRRL